jgi:alpha-galactosidase
MAAGVGACATLTVAAIVAAPVPAAALENGLARTPPMGFNNWNTTQCRSTFNETMIRGIADTFISAGLKDAGYQYVNIDDCWAEPNRDASGNLVPNRTRFPSGIKALADYVHSKGLKFGIYTSAGTKTCNRDGGFPGALNNEQRDANLFASWGVDYLKYDNCNNQGVDAVTRYTRMRDALRNTGRPIVYSIVEWGQNQPWNWAPEVGNLWRTSGDISDNWDRMISRVHINQSHADAAKPGAWNDPDMLEVGNGGMTATEYRTHFSLWAIMAAPLLIGSDIRNASATTLSILNNADLIAVDQDPLGRQGTVVSSSGGRVVYSKPLANGDRAVALLNETTATATVSTTASAIGLGGSDSYTLKDLWSKAIRTTTGAISASVPAHGTVVYRVTRGGPPPPPPPGRLEAEDATIFHGTVEADHAGFSGRGFVNYVNEAGSYVEWTVNTASATTATLSVRYANGTTSNRPMAVSVNGATPSTVDFPGTGNWDTWATATFTATLVAGTNTVRATATTAAGGPNVDWLETGVPPPPPPGRLEAEDATIFHGTVEADHAGFSGRGFVNYVNEVGSYVEWTVNASSAGTVTLSLRYANGTTTNRPMAVSVNGATPVTVNFPGTGSWDTWATATVSAPLAAGTNTVRATATTAAGGPNVDYLAVP